MRQSVVGCLLVVGIAVALVCPAYAAQEPATAPQATAAAPAAGREATAADLALLKKAMDAARNAVAFEVESDIRITGTFEGATLNFASRLRTVGKFPNKFRSEVQVQPNGASYLAVGDGTTVWTQRGGAEYSVKPLAEYLSDFPVPTQGLLCGLIVASKKTAASPAADFADPAWLKQQRVRLSVSDVTEPAAGRLFAFENADAQPGGERFSMKFLLDPATGRFAWLELGGFGVADADGKKTDLTVTEVVRAQSAGPQVTPATFKFTPPAGAKKVEKLSIGPF